MKLTKKQDIVTELHEKFAKAQIVVLTEYKGLNVGKINELRRRLKEAGAEYRVVKNTLLVRASRGTGVEVMQSCFKGPSAVMFTTGEAVASAKALTDFAKENDKLGIQAGVLGGKLLSAGDIKAIASLPSREVLLSQVLGALIAVPTGFVRVLNAVPQQLLNALQAIKDQKDQKEAA